MQIQYFNKNRRDKTKTADALKEIDPGQDVTMDIILNKHDHDTFAHHWHKYYLLVCGVYRKYCMLLGINNDKVASVADALKNWIKAHQCMSTF